MYRFVCFLEFIQQNDLIRVGFQNVEGKFGVGIRANVPGGCADDAVDAGGRMILGHVQNDGCYAGQCSGDDFGHFCFSDAAGAGEQKRERRVPGKQVQAVSAEQFNHFGLDFVLSDDGLKRCLQIFFGELLLDGGTGHHLQSCVFQLFFCDVDEGHTGKCLCKGRVVLGVDFQLFSLDKSVTKGSVQQGQRIVRTM